MNNYLNWLEDLVCRGPMKHKKKYYSKLLDHLDNRFFTWEIDLDEARANWGLSLRDKYIDDTHSKYCDVDANKPCSMLEMMVALAWRMEDEEASERWEPDFWDFVSIWFWGMIDNMGLTKNDNRNYSPEKTDICVDKVLKRGYNTDGRGGLFTLKRNFQHVKVNEIDIWRQAMLYMAELSRINGKDGIGD